jgi:hypothetical protein
MRRTQLLPVQAAVQACTAAVHLRHSHHEADVQDAVQLLQNYDTATNPGICCCRAASISAAQPVVPTAVQLAQTPGQLLNA